MAKTRSFQKTNTSVESSNPDSTFTRQLTSEEDSHSAPKALYSADHINDEALQTTVSLKTKVDFEPLYQDHLTHHPLSSREGNLLLYPHLRSVNQIAENAQGAISPNPDSTFTQDCQPAPKAIDSADHNDDKTLQTAVSLKIKDDFKPPYQDHLTHHPLSSREGNLLLSPHLRSVNQIAENNQRSSNSDPLIISAHDENFLLHQTHPQAFPLSSTETPSSVSSQRFRGAPTFVKQNLVRKRDCSKIKIDVSAGIKHQSNAWITTLAKLYKLYIAKQSVKKLRFKKRPGVEDSKIDHSLDLSVNSILPVVSSSVPQALSNFQSSPENNKKLSSLLPTKHDFPGYKWPNPFLLSIDEIKAHLRENNRICGSVIACTKILKQKYIPVQR
ncbi:hypothetical protein BY996DRAFT_6413498 [Phakopsora pachyrhizi]|nr:hypothetical protein BY996DRAFT_6413498 [Phakopsora pachyrhizi]